MNPLHLTRLFSFFVFLSILAFAGVAQAQPPGGPGGAETEDPEVIDYRIVEFDIVAERGLLSSAMLDFWAEVEFKIGEVVMDLLPGWLGVSGTEEIADIRIVNGPTITRTPAGGFRVTGTLKILIVKWSNTFGGMNPQLAVGHDFNLNEGSWEYDFSVNHRGFGADPDKGLSQSKAAATRTSKETDTIEGLGEGYEVVGYENESVETWQDGYWKTLDSRDMLVRVNLYEIYADWWVQLDDDND